MRVGSARESTNRTQELAALVEHALLDDLVGPVLRQNLIRLGRRTADAAATRQERRGTVDSASEAGRPAVWCPSGPTRERGGVQVGLPAALRKDGPEHGELIGLIRPPVGRSDGEGHRLRESR